MINEKELTNIMGDNMTIYGLASMARYIPATVDGLKPVQRSILYALYELHTGHMLKCVSIIGQSVNYITTGDTSIHGALVNMGQVDRYTYPLITAQGNYGSIIDSLDNYAAPRYLEGKLSDFAMDWYFPEDFHCTDWKDNYIGNRQEPVMLPTLIPMGLVMGSKGLAVGARNHVLPLSLESVCNAYSMYIKHKDKGTLNKSVKINILGALEFKMPNGCKVEKSDNIFNTGKGTVRLTGEWTIKELSGGKTELIVTKLPYMMETKTFMETLLKLPPEYRNMIHSKHDMSSKEGILLSVVFKKGANINAIMELLTYSSTFGSGGGLVETVASNYKYYSILYKKVIEYPILDIFEEHYNYKIYVLEKYFINIIKEAKDRIRFLNAVLYIISDKKRLDQFFDIIKKSKSTEELGDSLYKAFTTLDKDTLLYVANRKFTVMLKNHEDLTNQIKELNNKIKEAEYNNGHKAEYMINKISENLKKWK